MTEPSYKVGIPLGQKDYYGDLFLTDLTTLHKRAMDSKWGFLSEMDDWLKWDLSAPPDVPPMHRHLVDAMFTGANWNGEEDWVGAPTNTIIHHVQGGSGLDDGLSGNHVEEWPSDGIDQLSKLYDQEIEKGSSHRKST